MLIYIIRHGESLFNRENRIQGQTDVALSPFGEQQAVAIAECFKPGDIDAVISSPLQRAYQTARPLAERLDLEIQTLDDLKEIHAGIFSGLLWSEIENRFPEYSAGWNNMEYDFVIPSGESRRQLQERGVRALEHIATLPFERVAVVAHGGVLCAALKGLLRVPPETNPFSLFNASISRLSWNGKWSLLTLNQMEHLEKAGVAKEVGRGNL
ncbi:MAG: histidine phosphatase family protein [Pirellula sp.]|jgi:broad specificity phosphatase PhoE|nr:histidine phosphatase family protein [Pirellula sp.]